MPRWQPLSRRECSIPNAHHPVAKCDANLSGRFRPGVSYYGNTTAPQRATIEWFTGRGMSLIPGEGLLAAGVPGRPGALITALERFGTMTLADVLQPALDLARDGFPVHPGLVVQDYLAFSIWHAARRFRSTGQPPPIYPEGDCLKSARSSATPISPIRSNACLRRSTARFPREERRSEGRSRGVLCRGYRPPDRHLCATPRGTVDIDDLATFETKVGDAGLCQLPRDEVFKCGPWSQGRFSSSNCDCWRDTTCKPLGTIRRRTFISSLKRRKLAFGDREGLLR